MIAVSYFYRLTLLIRLSEFQVPTYSWEPPFLRDPTFFLDIVYVHHRSKDPIAGAACQTIYDLLCDVQREPPEDSEECGKCSYIVESHPSSLKFLPAVAAVLSHPVQRGELHGDDGMLAKMDPSDEYIASIRNKLQEAIRIAKAPESTGSTENKANARGDSAKLSEQQPALKTGSSTSFPDKVKSWGMFSMKKR